MQTVTLQGKSYGMTLPRLGNAIIINNVSQTMPGSEVDVRRLKEAYETVGFDVYVYMDCTTQVSICILLSLRDNASFL